jgi:2-dehydropantoate 2-reductase
MRIAIIGAGGVGGYFGGRLARAGDDVAFIARGEHLRAMREEGLRVRSVAGDFTVHPVRATDDPAEVGPVDAVLVATKTWQVEEACRTAAPLLGPETVVVTLQNGVEAPAQAARIVGRERVLPGVARIFSRVAEPGLVVHAGGPASVTFGELDGPPTPRVLRLRDALAAAGVAVETPDDVLADLWAKFLFVVPMGGVGALARAPVGVLRGMPETRRLLEEAMGEILAVARARGIRLPDDVVARTMGFVDGQPAEGTTSLQRDVAAGRPSELEAWCGAVVRLGAESGVPTPLHRVMYHALLPLERRARGDVEFADG